MLNNCTPGTVLIVSGGPGYLLPGSRRLGGATGSEKSRFAGKPAAAVRDNFPSLDRRRACAGYLLKRKNSRAVSVVRSAIFSSATPRNCAICSATRRVWAGSHRFPRSGAGARYGQSVSTMN
jgi:hypothetical protein